MAGDRLKIDIRRAKILELLQKEGQVSIAALSKTLGVTQTTLRTDLDTLSADGRLIRVAGGAVSVPQSSAVQGDQPEIPCAEEKTAIAKLAAMQIRDGDTLFLNSGTTTQCVARMLLEKSRLNVVTNSLSAAKLLGSSRSIHVVLLGGEINAEYGFTYGGDTAEQLQRYRSMWAILSVDGVDAQRGISTYHPEEAMIDRLMIRNSSQVIIAADHRKIGRAGFSHVCELSECSCIVTDRECDEAILSELKQTGISVKTADE